ncbi:MAG: RES family NAD+ phosphorylase [Proteobacteria bacterium]|nr:RES family NAD+ phosphorylase [Pseudomonadota bacterium]
MPKRKIPAPSPAPTSGLPGLLELDRFSAVTLEKWTEASRDIDQLSASLFFETEPERRRYREELLGALRSAPATAPEFSTWARIVTYRYSLAPLSCAGSLHDVGGRFNAGTDLDDRTLDAWPALYIAQDYETAFREKFQLASDDTRGGLNAQDLALTPNASHATVILRGKLSNVFALNDEAALKPICRVFRRIKMPAAALRLQKKLKISNRDNFMIRTPFQLRRALLAQNWRLQPMQFGMPSPSQIFAELVRAAGFEGILYESTKGPGQCLAIFPEALTDASYVELADAAPAPIKHTRLDSTTAEALCGWDDVAKQLRPRN